MKLSHEFTVPADPDRAWELLTDLHKVGSCFPGATVTEATEQDFSGTVKVKLGPIAMMYAGSGRFVERDDAGHSAVIEAQGKDKRGNGTAGATVTLKLLPDGSGSRAEVSTDLNITGKPAQFGRGVMQDVSDKLLGQFIACVEKQLGDDRDGAADIGTAAPDADPGNQAPDTDPGNEAPDTDPGNEAPDAGASSEAPDAASGVTGAATGSTTAGRAAGESGPTSPAPSADETSTGVGVAGAASTARPSAAQARPSVSSSRWQSDDDAIDLGGAVGPVLAKRYGGYVLAALVGLLIGLAFRRRRVVEVVEIEDT